MAEIVRMPAVLAGAAEAAIQTWLVQPGTRVTVDQTLAEIETEKAIVEFQSETGGVVGRLLASEGDNVAVGDPILVLVAPGEGDDAIDAALAASRATVPAPIAPTGTPAVPADGPGDHVGPRMFASPLVRRLAAQNAVDLADIVGTGPHGRIVRRDLERHLESAGAAPAVPVEAAEPAPPAARAEQPQAAGYEDVPLDRMRAAIARRLTESKATVPHFYVVADCRVDALLALRAQVNEGAARRISVNDFVLKAVAGAMGDVPAANAIWKGDSIRRYASVDIGVAIATDAGLTTPVLRGVERMPLSDVGAAVADFAERARSGRLRQHELEGGSFAVSNLGMYGTERFTAILNPPQSGILAVGAARKTPVVGAAGDLEIGTVMTVTLSADHRVIDGAVAAQWLAAFQRRIENPLTILI
jgi:pyruvate dehydrogenase E2 component (dihydrolipoamide acetyltransferase)